MDSALINAFLEVWDWRNLEYTVQPYEWNRYNVRGIWCGFEGLESFFTIFHGTSLYQRWAFMTDTRNCPNAFPGVSQDHHDYVSIDMQSKYLRQYVQAWQKHGSLSDVGRVNRANSHVKRNLELEINVRMLRSVFERLFRVSSLHFRVRSHEFRPFTSGLGHMKCQNHVIRMGHVGFQDHV